MRQIIGAAVGITFTVFRQPVGEVNHANAQRTTAHCAAFGSRNRVILIIEQSIQSAYCQNSQFFQLVQSFNGAQVECRQRTQRNFAVFIVDIVQRFGRQGNLQTQVRLAYRGDNRIERTVSIAVVNVLDIDTTGRGAFLHHQREQFDRFHTLFADAVVVFIFHVQAFEFVLVGEERIV